MHNIHAGKRKESSIQTRVLSGNFLKEMGLRSCLGAREGCGQTREREREREKGIPSGEQNDRGTDQNKLLGLTI